MIEYNWTITRLEIFPNENGLNNVIKNINYIRSAIKDGNTVSIEGTYTCELPNPNNYIEYENITQVDIEEWLNLAGVTNALDTMLYSQLTPVESPQLESLPLPWV